MGRRMSIRALVGIVLVGATVLLTPELASAQTTAVTPVSAVIPASGTVDSTFNFCNNDGVSNIACFSAHLHFVSRNEFQLSNVVLKDTKGDSRAVYADVYNQDGWLGVEFANAGGAGSSKTWKGPISVTYDYGHQFVEIALYACNSTSCSSVTWSLRHDNPHW